MDDAVDRHVVENFMAPMWGVLRFDPRDNQVLLLRATRDALAGFPDAALAEAARSLIGSRSVWPSVAIAVKACEAVKARHMIRIVPGTTAWAAWSTHWHRSNASFLARTYEQQGYALVPREFPPVEARR